MKQFVAETPCNLNCIIAEFQAIDVFFCHCSIWKAKKFLNSFPCFPAMLAL
jgi:hypothetical protein